MPCPPIVSSIVLNGFTNWYLNFQHIFCGLISTTDLYRYTLMQYLTTSFYFKLAADQLAQGHRWIYFKVNVEILQC